MGARDSSMFITVGGTITPLKQTFNEGKGFLAEWGKSVLQTTDETMAGMRKALADPGTMKAMESGLKSQIAGMQRAASEAIRAAQATPGGMDQFGRMTAVGATAAAEALEKLATAELAAAEAAEATTAANDRQAQILATNAAAFRASASSVGQQAAVYRDLAAVAPQATEEIVKVGGASGQTRMGMMVLGEQFRQFGTEVALGISPVQAFTQQIGQTTFALQMMGGEGNAFVKFLGSGWGIAIMTGVSVLGALIGALATAKQKTKEHQDALETLAAAMNGEKVAAETLNDALAKLNEQDAKSLDLTHQQITARLDLAKATLAQANAEKARLDTRLAEARTDQEAAAGGMTGRGPEGRAGRYIGATADLNRVQSEVDAVSVTVARATALVDSTSVLLARSLATHVGQANAEYDAKQTAMEEAYLGKKSVKVDDKGNVSTIYTGGSLQAAANNANELKRLTDELQQKETALTVAREKAVAAAQKLDDANKGKGVTEGSLVDKAMGADLFAAASKYRGDGEGNSDLLGLFRQANVNVDPKMTAWCAAFVNAVLATNGLPGTGSNAARSFLQYGSSTDKPVVGDIVVARRGNNAAEGHVGFYQGTDAHGNVLVLGGNTSNKVGTEAIAAKDVLGFRRVTGSASEMEAAARKAQEAADRQRHDEEAYAEALNQAAVEKAQLARDGATDAQELAKLDKAAIDVAMKKKAEDNKKFALDHNLTGEQLLLLDLADQQVADAKKAEIDRKTQQALTDKDIEGQEASLQLQAELLGIDSQLATTRKERLKIALELLENDRQQQLLANDKDLNDQRIDQTTHDQRAAGINAKANAQKAVIAQQNLDPMQQFQQRLHSATDDMNDALKGVEADGLQSLEDGLIGLITGTESVASAFKKMAMSIVADLTRIAVEKGILALISSLTGGGGGGGGGLAPSADFSGYQFADGGYVFGPGGPREDRVPAMLSAGEFVVNADATRRHGRLLAAINDNKVPHFADGGMVGAVSYPALPSAASLRVGGIGGERPIVVQHHWHIDNSVLASDLLETASQHAENITRKGITDLIDQNDRSYGVLLSGHR